MWDSEPEAEIEESWVKARPLLALVRRTGARMTLLAAAVAGRGLVDPAAPVFAADDEALLRGSAAFETLPVYGGRPFRLGPHVERLRFSASRLGLPPVDGRRGARRAGRGGSPRLRPAALSDRPRPGRDRRRDSRRPGGGARSAASRCRPSRSAARSEPLAGVKSTSYAFAFTARAAARGSGADDVVFTGERTRARGSDRKRLVAGRRRAVHAGDGAGVLPGVTREAVRELALELAYEVAEGAFPLADLLAADEAFETSSIREVVPVVDGRRRDRRRRARRRRGRAPAGRTPATLPAVSGTIRLGGMALGNGVLVHGPTAWACAIRTETGEVKVVARRKGLAGVSRSPIRCCAGRPGSPRRSRCCRR